MLLCLVEDQIFLRRSAQNFNYLYQLLLRTVSRKDWLQSQQLDYDATCRPHIDLSTVVCCLHHKLGCSVITRTNVGNIRLFFFEDLS